MDDLSQQIADATGYPAELVMRSAQARAQADGVPVASVLAAWSGGEAAPAADAAPAAAAPAPAAAAPAASLEPAAASGPEVEVLAPATPPASEGTDAADVSPIAEEEDEAEEKVAVGSGIPGWLLAAFVIIPVVAIVYALYIPNGPDCGRGAVLAVDPVDGQAVNCDGSEYGEVAGDFFAIGQTAYSQCTACHGAGGQGGGSFPAFTDGALLATFPGGTCEAQVEWVRLGSQGWPDATYGTNEKPVGGSGAIMPGFGTALTEEELRSVALYERVAFGGEPLEAAEADCGLVEGAADVEAAGE